MAAEIGSDVLAIVGFGALLAGLIGFDWRLACIVGGAILLGLGLAAAIRRNTARV